MPLSRGDRLALAAAGGGHHDKARQVLGLGTKPVEQPGSHRRAATDRRAGIHEGMGRVVVDRLGFE